jgi:hypothetical protein
MSEHEMSIEIDRIIMSTDITNRLSFFRSTTAPVTLDNGSRCDSNPLPDLDIRNRLKLATPRAYFRLA